MTSNQKNAEAYLLRIRESEGKIQNKRLELEALYYKAGGCTAIRYDKDSVQTSPQNYMEMVMEDIEELKQEIEEDEAQTEETRGNAYSLVRMMEKPEQRAMIEWFYLNCVSMQHVSRKMNMTERNAYYLREDALESFGSLMGK